MHGETSATSCPGKHHFPCLRIPCRRQGRRYRLHNYAIPDEMLSSISHRFHGYYFESADMGIYRTNWILQANSLRGKPLCGDARGTS